MIIDRAPLTGLDAYLRTADGEIELGGSIDKVAKYSAIGPGKVTKLDGISLLLVAEDLTSMLPRAGAGASSIFELALNKEIFPGLFTDPYAARIHTIAGNEDLSRGTLHEMRLMEVDGQPTLVSLGEGCAWRSAIYRFSQPVRLSAAAWDLVASRRTPADAFTYSLMLELWQSGDPGPGTPPDEQILLADGLGPDAPRAVPGFIAPPAMAYRLTLKARVIYDPGFSVLTEPTGSDPSYGRPLLRAVSLVEPYAPAHRFHSMAELMAVCSDIVLTGRDPGPPTHMTATLDLSGTLAEGEGLELRVAGGAFRHLQARVLAERLERPPITDDAV